MSDTPTPATALSKAEQKEMFKAAIKELFLEQYTEFGIFTLKFVLRTALLAAFGAVSWMIFTMQHAGQVSK